MMIYFMAVCHNFQHRLCWMLSSILEQVHDKTKDNPHRVVTLDYPKRQLPWIVIDIAHLKDNGYPTTESCIAFFRSLGLDVRSTLIEDKEIFAKRGLVRNIQTENAKKAMADWLFYADSDNVYHPQFFTELADQLKDLDNLKKVIFSRDKFHTQVEPTNELAALARTNKHINYAYKRALCIPRIKKANKNVAAGCCQVIHSKYVDYYVKPEECRDRHLFKKGQRAKSDVQFRNRYGQFRIMLPQQVHLNHFRDKELGYHSEEQR